MSTSDHQHEVTGKRRSRRMMLRSKTFRLISMLCLTLSFFLVELVVGNITNSVALVADAFHMLSDVISLVIATVAVRVSRRRSHINTFGWVRAEVVGANINTVFLLALCLTIVFDAIKRFIEPEPIKNVDLLLIVGSIGLGINIVGLFLFQGFHGHSHGGSSHGHSHGAKSHEHSHDANSHGHSHAANSHGAGSHGHSHENNGFQTPDSDERHDDVIPKDAVELDVLDLDTTHTEIGTMFDRHSTRALQEIIAECAHPDEESTDTVIEMPDKGKPKSNKEASMNMHGVFLHVLADALGSIVVIISALLIKFVPHDPEDHKHWTIYIDPTLSVLIVIIITMSTIPLFKETSSILLQTIPKHLEISRIKTQLLTTVPEIDGIHELHVWRLTDQKIIATAHLSRKNLSNYMSVADKVKKFFHSIGIHSVTIQYEHDDETQILSQNTRTTTNSSGLTTTDSQRIAGDCLLRCENEECDNRTCCTKTIDRTSIQLNTMPTDDISTLNQTNEN